jgi:succinoglycan biosynthesis transport protein ExoP
MESSALSFQDYRAALRRRSLLIFGIALPIVALAAMLAIGLPDVYRSSGFIEIESAQSGGRRNDESSGPQYADQYVQSLSTQVLAGANLRKLLEEHTLYDDQDENPDAALHRLREGISVDIVTTRIIDPSTGREREIVSAFTVALEHREPQRAYEGAKWLVEAFLAANRRDLQRQAQTAAQFYAKEAERMRQEVVAREERLSEFKRKNAGMLPELTQTNLGSIERTERDLRDAESQLQALRRERVLLVSQLQQARAAGPEAANLRVLEDEYRRKSAQYDPSHPDLVALRRQIEIAKRGGSPTGMSLQQQLANERAVLAEVRQRYSEDHPDVRRILRNIQTLETRIAAGDVADRSVAADSPIAMQLQAQLNATDSQIGALQARTTELRTRLSQLENRLAMTPDVEREYQQVTRDLASARAKYEELVKRRMDSEVNEAAIAGGRADKFKVVQEPSVPREPAKPRRLVILFMGLVVAGAIALSAAIAAEVLDHTVRGARDVRNILAVSPLVAVPVIANSVSLRQRRRRLLKFSTYAAASVVAAYIVTVQLFV